MSVSKPAVRFTEHLQTQLDGIRSSGLFKGERVLSSPQQPEATVRGGQEVLNLCANNYLGLANHPRIRKAAKDAIDRWGYGMASVRFICGTVEIHKELEAALAGFLGKADTILYSSCWDANGGLFETILGPEDAIISDELNHASIIDGIRLCKAKRLRYKNSNMADLEERLKEAADCRFRLIATDGVFSMDGTIANLPGVCELADKYDAMIMVDDSHATGFVGKTGRGTHEFHDCMERIDILTGTLGKALGGGSGGYTCGSAELVQMLRQRSRPYLFSNSLPPPIVAASLESLKLLTESTELRDRLESNTTWFRTEMTAAGFHIIPGVHPITPVMLGDAVLAANMAEKLLAKGLYVIGFSYPVVPMGKARIRTQVCAAHTAVELAFAVNAFKEAKAELGV
ncbi:MAG: glycine C-acetyltransferase [Planctomycetota bacterium]|nr:MAG: glycine C-acetyltransferase [Planctomycetota bacterium]